MLQTRWGVTPTIFWRCEDPDSAARAKEAGMRATDGGGRPRAAREREGGRGLQSGSANLPSKPGLPSGSLDPRAPHHSGLGREAPSEAGQD